MFPSIDGKLEKLEYYQIVRQVCEMSYVLRYLCDNMDSVSSPLSYLFASLEVISTLINK